MPAKATQLALMTAHLREHPLARARDLAGIGVAATTISRAVDAGVVERDQRGLYRLPDASIGNFETLAVLAKRVPRAVVCLTSALVFHGVTDRMPDQIWIGIRAGDSVPKISYPQINVVRYRKDRLSDHAETHRATAGNFTVHSVAKAIADVLNPRRRVEYTVAISAMKTALYDRKTTPDELARVASESGVWKHMEPYLETIMTGRYSGHRSVCMACGESSKFYREEI